MTKRILTFALAILMAFSCCVLASAEGKKETYPELGLTLTYPETFDQLRGVFLPSPAVPNSGIYLMSFTYYGLPMDEINRLSAKANAGGLAAEDTVRIQNSAGTLCYALAIDGGRGAEELKAALGLDAMEENILTQIGQAGDLTYYSLVFPDDYESFAEKNAAEYAGEFQTLQSSLLDVLKSAEFSAPRQSGDLVGSVVRFETKDLDGNIVKSEDLFAAHAVTMINIWATWCGPCRREMPELGEIARRLEADGRDAAIVGICDDANEKPEECKNLLAEYKVDYLNLMAYSNVLEQQGMTGSESIIRKLNISAFPTTLFIGRDGTVLRDPVIGVPPDISMYEEIIDEILAGEAAAD